MLGWFHYAERFRQLHQCQLECVMGQEINDLLAPQYPDITFSTNASVQTENPYASYRIGLFFGGDTTCQPIDFRKVGFHRNAGYIRRGPPGTPPRLKLDAARKIAEPYARGTIGLRAGYKESVQGNETSEYYRQMNLKIRF